MQNLMKERLKPVLTPLKKIAENWNESSSIQADVQNNTRKNSFQRNNYDE